MIDEYGYVTDLELAKKILIEFFRTGEYQYSDSWFRDKGGYYKEFLTQIKNELQPYDEGFVFFKEDGTSYFGGPEGASGYWIRDVDQWYKEQIQCPSVNGAISDLNNENTVFYEIDDKLKCFVIHEID